VGVVQRGANKQQGNHKDGSDDVGGQDGLEVVVCLMSVQRSMTRHPVENDISDGRTASKVEASDECSRRMMVNLTSLHY
jgi:hypothetical protein